MYSGTNEAELSPSWHIYWERHRWPVVSRVVVAAAVVKVEDGSAHFSANIEFVYLFFRYLLEQQGVVENDVRKLLNGAHNLRESESLCVRRHDNDHVVTLHQQPSTIRMDASNNHLSAGTWPNGQNISNPTFISMTMDAVTSNQNLNPITTNSHSNNQKVSSPDKLQESMISLLRTTTNHDTHTTPSSSSLPTEFIRHVGGLPKINGLSKRQGLPSYMTIL
ncbi:hypothetical protein Tco_1066581 [Tanacetum coccineum]|uniref:Uncharacterized protein n=1 Tax=Tanacetum coccineum TaxID=301880 RepID=A0ABQ5HAH5_9ASTR